MSWLAATRWAPVVDEAVSALPPTGTIETGLLRWPEKTGRLLAANPFLSFEVTLDAFHTDSAPVDFAFEFRPRQVVLRSLLGAWSLGYPKRFATQLNRTALLPAWGAWKAPILFGLIPATMLILLLTWSILALPYSLIALLIGSIFRRDLGFTNAWKLCVAAQLPGSLLMAFAIALYSTGQISLLFLLIMLPAHFLPTLLYILISPVFTPKLEIGSSKQNPFESERTRAPMKKNPFSGG